MDVWTFDLSDFVQIRLDAVHVFEERKALVIVLNVEVWAGTHVKDVSVCTVRSLRVIVLNVIVLCRH